VAGVRVQHHPSRSLVSRRASRECIPEASGLTARRRRSHRSPAGDYSSPPFRPAARARCGSASLWPRLSALGGLTSLACARPTLPSADCCAAVREESAALRPLCGHPAELPRSAVRPSVPRRPLYQAQSGVEGGRRGRGPARPHGTTPPIGFVSLAPHVRSTRPSDPTAR
jgi:hypothetical protein